MRRVNGPMVPSVLIVDDEKHTREGLQQALAENYDVTVAAIVGKRKNVGGVVPLSKRVVEQAAFRRAHHAQRHLRPWKDRGERIFAEQCGGGGRAGRTLDHDLTSAAPLLRLLCRRHR